MAQVTGNQYYDPSARAAEVSQGVGGLAEALFGNPVKATANDFQLSEAALNKAKTERQLMENNSLSGAIDPAMVAMGSGKFTPEQWAEASRAATIQGQNPAIFNGSPGMSTLANALETRKALAVEAAKPEGSDEAMAGVFKTLPLSEQIKIAKQHLAPDRSGMPSLDPETGEILPAAVAPDLPENNGSSQYLPDTSTMGSMINSLNQSAPKAASVPPPFPAPSSVQNGSAQDPVTASRDAIAAQQQVTGVSPAQRPDLKNPTPEQVLQQGAPTQPTAPRQRTFGFNLSGTPPAVWKGMVDNDKKQILAAQIGAPTANNVLRILDQLEPNLKNFNSGFAGDARLMGDKALSLVSGGSINNADAVAGNNIEKGTNDLATELSKFQPVPGMRSSVALLDTILKSKPGVSQLPEVNANIMAGLRAKVTDYQLSTELAQKYREASPLKVTDANTEMLDQALKTIFPTETVDQKTGASTFNKDNVMKIRQFIPQAIANPKPFIDHANAIMSGQAQAEGGAPIQPAAAAESPEAKALKAGFTPEQIQEYKRQRGIK